MTMGSTLCAILFIAYGLGGAVLIVSCNRDLKRIEHWMEADMLESRDLHRSTANPVKRDNFEVVS